MGLPKPIRLTSTRHTSATQLVMWLEHSDLDSKNYNIIAWAEIQSLLYSTYRAVEGRKYIFKISAHLQDLGEGLHDARILVTIHLNGVNERDFSLCAVAERLENGCEFL